MQASEIIILVFINLFHFDGGSPGRFLGSDSAGSEGQWLTTQCDPLLWGICQDIFYNHLYLQNIFLFWPLSSVLLTKGKHGNLSSADKASRSSC